MGNKPRTVCERWRIRHEWNKRTGLYAFMGQVLAKLLAVVVVIVAAILLLNHYFNLGDIIEHYIFSHDTPGVLALFFISETLLGLIPPDLFIMWSDQYDEPLKWLTILGTISYLGGMAAYQLGRLTLYIPRLRAWLEKRNEEFFDRIHKWGGVIIILAAMFPLPFATTTLAAGMVKYPFGLTMLYGLSRYLRFYLYGLLIFFGMDKLL